MKAGLLVGLLALVPAAVNASAPASTTIMAPTCTGAFQAVTIPVNPIAPVQQDGQPCCAKGCHANGSRKRLKRAP
jgi:hypothetical protein